MSLLWTRTDGNRILQEGKALMVRSVCCAGELHYRVGPIAETWEWACNLCKKQFNFSTPENFASKYSLNDDADARYFNHYHSLEEWLSVWAELEEGTFKVNLNG